MILQPQGHPDADDVISEDCVLINDPLEQFRPASGNFADQAAEDAGKAQRAGASEVDCE